MTTLLSVEQEIATNAQPNEPATAVCCPLCPQSGVSLLFDGVRDHEYGAPGSYEWWQCASCGLVQLRPQPTDAILAQAYPPSYHGYHESGSRLVGWYVNSRKAARARALAGLLPAGGTILDVGCGTGALLERVGRRGSFRLLGVEYQSAAAETARRRGIAVWTGDLEDADIPAGSVDVAVLEHVIEHVRDPLATLRRIARLLRPGGVLVGETPNFACPEVRLAGRYWGGGHAPRHLWLFTPRSLGRALRAAGLTPGPVTHPIYPAHLALSVQNWLRRSPGDLRGLTRGRAWYFPLVCAGLMPVAVAAALGRCSGAMGFTGRRDRQSGGHPRRTPLVIPA